MPSRVDPKVYLYLAIGVWAGSTAVLWIRLSPTPPAILCGLRLLLSVALLFPFFWRDWIKAQGVERKAAFWLTIVPGAALAAHFVSWTYGARMTYAANATLIANMAMLAMPFMLWITQKERVRRQEWIGTGVALMGIALLFGAKFRVDSGSFTGELVCFGSMLLLTFYLALGRLNRKMSSFWLYLVPVYAWASLISFLLAFSIGEKGEFPTGQAWVWLVLLAVLPTILGHGLMNFCLRHLGGQMVSIAGQGQFIFAAPAAYFLFGEVPGILFYPAAALVVAGCWLTTRSVQSD